MKRTDELLELVTPVRKCHLWSLWENEHFVIAQVVVALKCKKERL